MLACFEQSLRAQAAAESIANLRLGPDLLPRVPVEILKVLAERLKVVPLTECEVGRLYCFPTKPLPSDPLAALEALVHEPLVGAVLTSMADDGVMFQVEQWPPEGAGFTEEDSLVFRRDQAILIRAPDGGRPQFAVQFVGRPGAYFRPAPLLAGMSVHSRAVHECDVPPPVSERIKPVSRYQFIDVSTPDPD